MRVLTLSLFDMRELTVVLRELTLGLRVPTLREPTLGLRALTLTELTLGLRVSI